MLGDFVGVLSPLIRDVMRTVLDLTAAVLLGGLVIASFALWTANFWLHAVK